MIESTLSFIVALGVAFSASAVWRFMGVLLSARIDPNGPLMRWFVCVAYAMLAALVAGYFVLPGGALGTTPIASRLAALAAAAVAYVLLGRRIAIGVTVGLVAFLAVEALGGRIAL
ncbi:MAG: AzlD domain-containing protein [Alphaproteobacteria bacterium]